MDAYIVSRIWYPNTKQIPAYKKIQACEVGFDTDLRKPDIWNREHIDNTIHILYTHFFTMGPFH